MSLTLGALLDTAGPVSRTNVSRNQRRHRWIRNPLRHSPYDFPSWTHGVCFLLSFSNTRVTPPVYKPHCMKSVASQFVHALTGGCATCSSHTSALSALDGKDGNTSAWFGLERLRLHVTLRWSFSSVFFSSEQPRLLGFVVSTDASVLHRQLDWTVVFTLYFLTVSRLYLIDLFTSKPNLCQLNHVY